MPTATTVESNRGFHPVLEDEQRFIFIDTCAQMFPDADFANAHRHGVTAYGLTVLVNDTNLDLALGKLMFWRLITRKHPNLVLVDKASDIRSCKQAGKAGIFLAAQDGDWISDRLYRIEAFYELGLRMMLPAYNRDNLICDGCLDRTDGGLSRFGELVVQECNRVGMLLDCTHIGRRASLDIMTRSSDPVVFSHSNPRAVVDNPRNIDDEQIKACAATGGVIGAVVWGPLNLKTGATKRPTVDDYVDAIDYLAQLLGSVDNIGIGTDFCLGTYPDRQFDPWGDIDYFEPVERAYHTHIAKGSRTPLLYPEGFSTYPEILNLVAKLHQRGYSEDDVRRILGENYLRVFERVWK